MCSFKFLQQVVFCIFVPLQSILLASKASVTWGDSPEPIIQQRRRVIELLQLECIIVDFLSYAIPCALAVGCLICIITVWLHLNSSVVCAYAVCMYRCRYFSLILLAAVISVFLLANQTGILCLVPATKKIASLSHCS